MRERIESAANRKIKLAASLRTRKGREREGLFLVEGIRLAEMALQSDWQIAYALFTPAIMEKPRGAGLLERLEARCPLCEVDETLFKRVAATESPQGIALVMQARRFALDALPVGQNESLYVVLDGVQDPGNAGTIIRTADAVGADGVICLHGTVDVFGDKAVRSAMGSLFHLPVCTDVQCQDLMALCAARGITLFAAALDREAMPHFEQPLDKACAIVFGNEGNGISKPLLCAARHVYIPMYGAAESLNVGISAAVILYEAVRQRRYGDYSAQQK